MPTSSSSLRKDVDHLKAHTQQFILSPKLWKQLSSVKKLTWTAVPFAEGSRSLIPTKRGIYCFLIAPDAECLPPHGYLIYLGETGDTGDANLRRRFGDYLQEAESVRRPKMFVAFSRWRGFVSFVYAPITDKRRKLKKLEMQLNDALRPPYNELDFSAEVRPAQKALR